MLDLFDGVSLFWTLFGGDFGHDGRFGVPSTIPMILRRLLCYPSNLHVEGLSS